MKQKEIKEKIDKILKTYLARTIAVNQFGLREKLLELFEQKKQKWGEERLPERKEIRKSRTTDEKRYPIGWNACLEETKKRFRCSD